jgi:uncharacterized protein (TIGR00725 family)
MARGGWPSTTKSPPRARHVAFHIGVVGSGEPDATRDEMAEQIGREIAEAGAVLVCGGLGGVMAAACRGAVGAGGLTVGLLPGTDRTAANRWVRAAVPTGLGEVRNCLVVQASDVVIAVGGEYGTLSEISFAMKLGRPVVGVSTWRLIRPEGTVEGGLIVADALSAVATALSLVEERSP